MRLIQVSSFVIGFFALTSARAEEARSPQPPPSVAATSSASRADTGATADQAAPAINASPATVAIPSPASATLLVLSGIPGTPPVNNIGGTTNNPYLQINGMDDSNTGYLVFKYGANAKGASNVIVKTRGTTMNDYTSVQSGDRLVSTAIQAGTGKQAGHAGVETWTVDGPHIFSGEVNGRWLLATGTGVSYGQAPSTQYPERYGQMYAIVANSFQQVYFPGGIQPLGIKAGGNFGGWVVIGAGGAAPGFGPLKFQTAGAQTLKTPEPGAFEVDANGTPYFTRADGVRRSFDLGDTGTPDIVAAASAGRGATVSVDASGSSGRITLTTGTAPAAGEVLTLIYAHAYASASYPVFSFGNANGPVSASHLYVTGTKGGFTLIGATPLAANTVYVFDYQAPGK